MIHRVCVSINSLNLGLFAFIAPRPSGCDCIDFGTCNWSIAGAESIAIKDSNWLNQANRIKKHSCNSEQHAIWCCGAEQLAPDFGKPY